MLLTLARINTDHWLSKTMTEKKERNKNLNKHKNKTYELHRRLYNCTIVLRTLLSMLTGQGVVAAPPDA